MCDSIAKGGRRCASHTYPAYRDAVDDCINKPVLTPNVLSDLLGAATRYASTPKGSDHIGLDIKNYATVRLRGHEVSEILKQAYTRGLANMRNYDKREAEIAEIIKHRSEWRSHPRVDVSEAIEVVSKEIAQGLDVPAPIGSFMFEPILREMDSNYEAVTWREQSFGLYQSEEEAQHALALAILAVLESPNGRSKTWIKLEPDDKESWTAAVLILRASSDTEVIDWYQRNGSDQPSLWINRREVSPNPQA